MLALAAVACVESGPAAGAPPPGPSTTTTTIVRTTTTLATTTTTPAPTTQAPPSTGTVGFVGCSVIQDSVRGYAEVGGARMWRANLTYGGGTIAAWSRDITEDRGRYWAAFRERLGEEPDTSVILWGLCTSRGQPADSVENALAVLEEIRRLAPEAVIYVTAQPSYAGGHVCQIAGDIGPSKMADIAAELVATEGLLPGPELGPIGGDETRDGCHANDAGQAVLGGQLLEFFG